MALPRIAYIEIDTHAEIVRNFRELVSNTHNFIVDYYLSEKIITLLGTEPSVHLIRSDSSVLLKQLASKKYDLVIIGTAHRYFGLFYTIAKKYKTAIICHNLNFIKSKHILFSIKFWKKDFFFKLKLLLKEKIFLREKLYKRAAHHLVLDANLESTNFSFLPLFYNKFPPALPQGKHTIVIPGTVEQQRRDYKHIISLLPYLSHARVIFLGKAGRKELPWLQEAERLFPKVDLVFFEEKVSQSEFDYWMKKAHFLWCPIQEKTFFMGVEECYGVTKMSGNIGDAITYGKAAIFPEAYFGKYPFVYTEQALNNTPPILVPLDNYLKPRVQKLLIATLYQFIQV